MSSSGKKSIPLILASALFMQNLDATALATSLPQIALSLNYPVLSAHSLITSYMLSLALFLPVSGWVADRFGPVKIFCLATGLFTLASLLCGLSTNFHLLIAARILQGMGGALMVPVARLLLVRVVPKHELAAAIALTGIPSIIGPILGPMLGGAIVTFASWRWIFFINLPVGIAAILLIRKIIPEITPDGSSKKFDWPGFALLSGGMASSLYALDNLHGAESLSLSYAALLAAGLLSLTCYAVYALRTAYPLLDIRLLRLPTFRASVVGGSLFRIGIGAYPFLMPLMLQTGFGFSPIKAGALTCLTAVGSLGMRFLSLRIVAYLGYRKALIWCGLIATCIFLSFSFLTATTPLLLMGAAIIFGGVFRSVQFTVLNTIVFAETSQSQASHANTFSQMAQRVSQTLGVTIAALTLHYTTNISPGISPHAFSMAFLVVGTFMLGSIPLFHRLNPLSTSQIDVADKRERKQNPTE